MVGHTHEDIDALFGHVSMWLRKHDALTLPGESVNFEDFFPDFNVLVCL